MNLPDNIQYVIKTLNKNGYDAYLVGGCVRDTVMDRVPHDYDITTNALPEETEECFKESRLVLSGKKHGTIGIIQGGECIEVTTYRIDGDYTDSRHPDSVTFTRSIENDLARRDFTMNAIAMSDEKTVDPFCGKEDIINKTIRCVGNPEKRFTEDALRIMRAMRFSSVLGFDIEPDTKSAMHKTKKLLGSISSERIYTELCKLICGINAKSVLLEFSDIICEIIPEFIPCIGFNQHNPHHCFDVYTHTAEAVSSAPDDICTRLALLFHDIGKPHMFFTDENGIGHFYGHADKSRELADGILSRLKASNNIKNTVTELIRLHDREIVNTKPAVKRFMSKTSEDIYSRIFDVKKADNMALAPEYRSRVTLITETENTMKEIIDEGSCFSLKQLAVNGKDLINEGIPQSAEIGKILNELFKLVISGKLENNKKILLEYSRKCL